MVAADPARCPARAAIMAASDATQDAAADHGGAAVTTPSRELARFRCSGRLPPGLGRSGQGRFAVKLERA
jgi:hypothetical protein